MKRILALLAVAAMASPPVGAELRHQEFTANATANTLTTNAQFVFVKNDSTDTTIYVRVFWEGETVGNATTADTPLYFGEGFTYGKTSSVKAVSVICASGQTAAVRVQMW